MDEKEEGEMMVVKVGKAGQASTRMVKETSRSRKPRNALQEKSNADTGASATQLEIRVNATTGILWQNGKICYSNTERHVWLRNVEMQLFVAGEDFELMAQRARRH